MVVVVRLRLWILKNSKIIGNETPLSSHIETVICVRDILHNEDYILKAYDWKVNLSMCMISMCPVIGFVE